MANDCNDSNHHALVENLPHGFALCRLVSGPDQPPDFIILETNKAFEAITGFTRVNGKKASRIELSTLNTLIARYQTFARVIKTGITERFELHLDIPDKWLDVTVYKSGDDCFAILIEDITERKTSEFNSRRNNLLLEKLTSQVPVMLYEFERKPDGSYRVPYSNNRVHDIFGCHPWEIRDELEPVLHVIHPEDRDKLSRSIEESARTLQPWHLEFRVQLPGEPVKWILGRSAPEKMNDGSVVWCGYNMDITEQKSAEQALKENRDFFEKIISKVPGMVYQFIRRPDGTSSVPYCNESIRDIYGCSPSDVRENFAPIYDRVYPEDREQLSISIEQSARELSPWQCEHRVQIPGKPITWVLGKSTPEKLEDGSILWTGYEVDITEHKTIELEKEQLQSRLIQAQKMESVGRLAGGIAHDFNNMLSVIVGHTEMVLQIVDPKTSLHASLHEIFNAARRSADLTRQLLTFARKQITTPKVLSLNDTIAGMLNMLRRLIGEDIEICWCPGDGLWDVMIDPSQVDQLLANLTVNARDAIAGVGKIIIETANITLDKDGCVHKLECVPGEYVLLTVSDNGCGMDRRALTNIFEPFFTTKKEGQGTGLGLATVYGIVKQNNGAIYVYSEPGQGSTFRIYLPRHLGEKMRMAEEKEETAIRGGTETILVVEDETPVLNLIRGMLKRRGYHVLVAGKTNEAMVLARQNKIDLLLTDVIMPEMNGKELYDKISAENPGLKCLYMSGYTAEVISRQGILDEGLHFITKPFSQEDLDGKIREILDSQ